MTNMIQDEIFKRDTRGRVRVPAERRSALLEEFDRSGISGAKFAALVGINYQTFASWRQKRKRERDDAAKSSLPGGTARKERPARWVEALLEGGCVPSGKDGKSLNIHLPGGARMEIADERGAKLAADLLKALASQGHLAC